MKVYVEIKTCGMVDLSDIYADEDHDAILADLEETVKQQGTVMISVLNRPGGHDVRREAFAWLKAHGTK